MPPQSPVPMPPVPPVPPTPPMPVKQHMSMWAKVLLWVLAFIGLVAVAGVGYAAYRYHERNVQYANVLNNYPDGQSVDQVVEEVGTGLGASTAQKEESKVVLDDLAIQRAQGDDAGTKSYLTGLRASAEIYASEHNSSYAGMCNASASDDSGINQRLAVKNYASGTKITCNVSQTGSAYAVDANLVVSGYWCVDSLQTGKMETQALGSHTVCN